MGGRRAGGAWLAPIAAEHASVTLPARLPHGPSRLADWLGRQVRGVQYPEHDRADRLVRVRVRVRVRVKVRRAATQSTMQPIASAITPNGWKLPHGEERSGGTCATSLG